MYVASFNLEIGESTAELAAKFPGGELGPALESVPFPVADGQTGTDLYIQQDRFREVFAADAQPWPPEGAQTAPSSAADPCQLGAPPGTNELRRLGRPEGQRRSAPLSGPPAPTIRRCACSPWTGRGRSRASSG